MQFSKCRSCFCSAFPLSTRWPWSLCLLPSVGTCLFTCEPTKLGKDTATALSKAANVLKSWRICTRGTRGAVTQTPSLRGQQLPGTPCPSAQLGRAGRAGPRRYASRRTASRVMQCVCIRVRSIRFHSVWGKAVESAWHHVTCVEGRVFLWISAAFCTMLQR